MKNKYWIEQFTPYDGVTRLQSYITGEYSLDIAFRTDSLDYAIIEFMNLIRKHGDISDFELRTDEEKRILITIDGELKHE